MSTTLIKNGIIVTHMKSFQADIMIKDDKIKKIGNINQTTDKIIDAHNNYILPGRIDPHTHLDLKVMNTTSADNFQSGTMSALFGGTTTIIDFANQKKGEDLFTTFNNWKMLANNNSYCDYSAHLSITDLKIALRDLETTIEQFGVCSFKTFTTYPSMKISYEDIFLLAEKLKDKALVTIHSEDDSIIKYNTEKLIDSGKMLPKYHAESHPQEAELIAIDHLIKKKLPLYFVHVSTGSGCKKIATKKDKFIETCIQYLILDDSKYNISDPLEQAKFILSPPLRMKKEQNLLWEHLKNGDIDVVATDHCSFTLKQKKVGLDDFRKIPNGIGSIEHCLELLYTYGVNSGKISIERLVEVLSYNPAKIFGLKNKGEIREGKDADLVIFNPNEKHFISKNTHHSKSDYSPYEGLPLMGKVKTVLLRGKVVIDNEKCLTNSQYGNYLKREFISL